MPTTIATGTVLNVLTNPAIDLTTGDTVTVEAAAYALSDSASAAAHLRGTGVQNYTVDIEGALSGYGLNTTGLLFGAGLGSTHTVTVGVGGTIFGRDGGILVGTGNVITSLTNSGLISTNDSTGTLHAAIDIFGSGDSTFNNYGTISSTASNGINFSATAAGNHTIINLGIIRVEIGSAFAINADATTASVETINNNGYISGAVSLGAGADAITNTSTIQGNVSLGSGADSVSNRTGVIFGTVDLGDGVDFFDGSNRDTNNVDTVNGGLGNDTMNGNAGNDILNGGGDDDTIDGGAGNDQMTGGTGNDTYFVDSAGDTIVELTTSPVTEGIQDVVNTSVSYQLAVGVGVEILQAVNSADTTALQLFGNEQAQTIIGNAGNNRLSGGADHLTDTLIGLAGNDEYVLADRTEDTVIDSAGIDTITSTIDRSLAGFAAIENLTLLAGAAIAGTGNALANVITGNANANTLDGGVDGLADTLIGGLGNDTYIIRSTNDVITEVAGGGAADKVQAAVSYTLGAAAHIEVMETTNAAGTAAINLTGNALLAQQITGNAGGNILSGGVDALQDLLVGLGGNDTYVLGASTNDVISENAGAAGGIDTITSTINRALTSFSFNNVENLTLLAGAAIVGSGNDLDNKILGNANNNVLDGGALGNDTLCGGLGNDTLTGGAGNDTFLFNTALNATTNKDLITDFSASAVGNNDVIQLENTGIFAALTTLGTLAATGFIANAIGVAATAAQHIIYNTATGALYYDATGGNGTVAGMADAVQFATLGTVSHPTITAADFFVI